MNNVFQITKPPRKRRAPADGRERFDLFSETAAQREADESAKLAQAKIADKARAKAKAKRLTEAAAKAKRRAARDAQRQAAA